MKTVNLIEKVGQICESKNIEILSLDQYTPKKGKIKVRCLKCGKVWEAYANNLSRGHGCRTCSTLEKNKRKSLENKERFLFYLKESTHYIMVGGYINQSTKVKLKCTKDNHIWEVKPTSIIGKRKTGCPVWKGGVSDVTDYLRRSLIIWKKEMLELYSYRCAITGRKDKLCVHHHHNFWKIVEEAHAHLSIEIKSKIGDYTEKELNLLENYVLNRHNKETGIVITEEVHKHFHHIYGNKNNNKKQFENFARDYYSNFELFEKIKIEK